MLVFLDTEFTDFIQCDLISIGMVTEDGHHVFYAERSDFEQSWCNPTVRAEILPLLDGSNLVTREELVAQLRTWFAALPTQVEIGCGHRTDWDLLLDALDGQLPPNVENQWQDLHYLIENAVFNEAMIRFHSLPKKPWHHALHDAEAYRAGWIAWDGATNEVEKHCWQSRVQGFIQDEYAAQKDKNRREFGELVKHGLAKASDASMFHGSARKSKVKYRDEDF